MGRLIYSVIGSLDGYMADAEGGFGWAEPGEEVFRFVTELERSVGTYLLGRKMYEMMTVWETDPAFAAESPDLAEFARVWQAADKIVYSTTLQQVSTSRTTLLPEFDPIHVAGLKSEASSDLNIAGPTLAAHAFRAGLVDELQVFVAPVLVGSGLSYYPDTPATLTLREVRQFDDGMVWLRYDVSAPVDGADTVT